MQQKLVGYKVTQWAGTAEEEQSKGSVSIGNIIKPPLSKSHQGQALNTS